MAVQVRIENDYEDGHHSERVVTVPYSPYADTAEWWEDVVYPHTGDGHGAGGLGSCYTATIVAADEGDENTVGASFEWVG